jgi:hypothetical protein
VCWCFYHDQNSISHGRKADPTFYAELFLCIDAFRNPRAIRECKREMESALLVLFVKRDILYERRLEKRIKQTNATLCEYSSVCCLSSGI